MAKQDIDIGVEGNDGTGDSIRESFRKVNENFNELYAVFGAGGQISFTNLGDTPEELSPRKILLVNDAATALDFVEITSDSGFGTGLSDSVVISYDIAGKIILRTSFRALQSDEKPALGGPLDAFGYGIANVAISQAAVNEWNDKHTLGGGGDITIDDLVITKGYADNRYIAGDLPIRVDDEPLNASEYTFIVQAYINGNIVVADHGFDRTINGTPYVFRAEDTDPSNLTSGTVYYLRYFNKDQFSIHRTAADATVPTQPEADINKINVTFTIDPEDQHTFVDAAFDSSLAGFFLSNEALPRKSIVRRQGDKMTGPLILHDSPGELAGLTNNPEDLQAATKFYVDNTAFSSPTNLYVSTAGNDNMQGVPAGKEGTSWSYAYSSINKAARRAEEIIRAAEAEPGPYMQTITRDNGTAEAEIISAGIINPVYTQARALILANKEYIIREVSAYLEFTYPDFEYNITTCERDLGLILDAIAFDISRSQNLTLATANSLTRIAAERYYSNPSAKLAITRQQTQTVAAIETAKDIIADILVNRLYQQTSISNITQSVICRITTSLNHGLTSGNIILIKNVGGMTELNDKFYYVKVIGPTTLEIFEDKEFTIPVNSLAFTQFTSGGVFGLVYQTDNKQVFNLGNDASAVERNGVRDKFDLVINIIQNGIDAGSSVVYGKTYKLVINNGGLNSTDQGNLDNRDVLPGKILVGKISGAQGRVISYTTNSVTDDGNDVIELHLQKAIDFIPGEGIEYGNFVKRNQVTIFVESGQYEEDYPIKVPANVSVVGDEFRRVIIRPKDRVSQSPWAKTYIYRDLEFDGITVSTNGYRFYNQTNEWQGHFGYHYLTNPEKEINVGVPVVNAGDYESAAAILKENKQFIQEEVINYINNNFKDILYDKDQFRVDLADIISGVTYDMTLDTNFNAVLYGLKFQRSYSIYKDPYLKELWVVGLTEAKRIATGTVSSISATAETRLDAAFDEIINIIENGELDTDSAASSLVFNDIPSTDATDGFAKTRLENNREFIAQEALAYIKLLSPRKYFDDAIRLRDFRSLVDALCYDIFYGGNFASVSFVSSLFVQNVLRLEITTRQETIETLTHLKSIVEDLLLGTTITPTEGNLLSPITGGSNATSSQVNRSNNLLDIIITQLSNNNLLNLPVIVYPTITGVDVQLQAAQTAVIGAITTIQDSSILEIDGVVVFNYNQAKCRRDVGLIVDALIDDLLKGGDEFSTEVQGEYYTNYIGQFNNNGFSGQENATKGAMDFAVTVILRLFEGAYNPSLYEQNPNDSDFIAPDFKYGVAESGTGVIVSSLVDKIKFVFDSRYNPPKRNDEMDVFMMNDATILRNITVQGHGGFLCVLDPEGQILTKSPYIQTGSSFSKSFNRKVFAGGMFVDAYCGNLPAYIPTTIDVGDGAESGKINNFVLWIRSEEGQGLFIRPPELPCPFYIEGRRYQVNAISDYDAANGWCKIYLDNNSNEGVGYDESQFEENPGVISRTLYLQTAGNRSMLGNDFTQVNDLGYGLVTNNGAFSEMVSMFTYYCQAAYYAARGSEIRSLNGSNGYGNFGLVAEGADPNEIPDQVTYAEDMTIPAKAFSPFTDVQQTERLNEADTGSLYVTDMKQPPQPNSIVVIDHGGDIGVKRYEISAVSIFGLPTAVIDEPTGGVYNNIVYRLQIIGLPEGTAGDFYSRLQADVPNGTLIEYRTSETHLFDGTRNRSALVTRPSTAVNFDESDYATYRSISFSGNDNYGNSLESDQVQVTFEIPFNVVEMPTDFNRIVSGTGGSVGDTTIAVRIDDPSGRDIEEEDIIRLTRDIAGRQPPEANDSPNAYSLIERNIKFIQEEVVAFVNNTYPALSYDEAVFYREMGVIADSAARDLLFGGNANCVYAAREYFKGSVSLVPAGQKAATIAAINYLRDLVVDHILTQDNSYVALNGNGVTQDISGSAAEANSGAKATININIISGLINSENILSLPEESGYTGGMIFTYGGRSHQIINFREDQTAIAAGSLTIGKSYRIASLGSTDWNAIAGTSGRTYVVGDEIVVLNAGSGTGNAIDLGSYLVDINYYPVSDISGVQGGGLAATISNTAIRVLYATIPEDTTAEITINISLCRATGHDFTQIGTGSFNESNYPNVILGPPEKSLAPFYVDSPTATAGQVWERRKGRVFWMSTDQFGFFRVGKFFSVDQGQGSISFSGEIGITGANEFGFKKGVPIDEFSTDDTMADESDNKVPVEKAIVGYVNKRLGFDNSPQGSAVPGRLGPGVLPLSGSQEMEGNLQMGNNNITNLATPNNGSDAANKVYVDDRILEFDNYEALRNVSKNRAQKADLLLYTGCKKILTSIPVDSLAGGLTFAVDDLIEDVSGTKQGKIVDIIEAVDNIVGEDEPGNNILIIVYELQEITPGVVSADFNDQELIEGTGLKSSVSATILRGPFDEIGHAREAAGSIINFNIIRNKSIVDNSLIDPIAEINFQIENETIINADISPDASIVQSKLLMSRAKPLSTSSGLFGTNDDVGQNNRGLAAFDGNNLSQELELTLSGPITVNQGDYIYQGTKVGTVTQNRVSNTILYIRTSDSFEANPTVLTRATFSNGVLGSQATLSVTVNNVNSSGFIGIKERSIGFTKLNQIPTDTVLGRSTPNTGDVESVTFNDVIDQGFGLQDIDFEDSEITILTGQIITFASDVSVEDGTVLTQDQGSGITVTGTVQGKVVSEKSIRVVNVTNTNVPPQAANFNLATINIVGGGVLGVPTEVLTSQNFTGSALIKQSEGVYGTTVVSTSSTNDSIVRRTSTGAIQGNSYIIGGSSSNEIMTEAGGTLTIKAPAGGTILTANGSTNPTVNIPGNINNGNTSVTQSTFQLGSNDGGSPPQATYAGKGFVTTNWLYTPFIEAPGERDAQGTGISLGAGTGFANSAADRIILITGGSERLRAQDSGVIITGTLDASSDFKIATNKFTVTASNGNTAIAGTLSATGNFSINTNKFNVTASNGNTAIAGTLTVTSNATFNGNVDLGNAGTDTVTISGKVDSNIIPTGSPNIGSATDLWNTVYATTFSGTATTAKYADLAENYQADADYEPGTVLIFGGTNEVTATGFKKGDRRVAGVVSTNPAHLMNSNLEGENVVSVALVGRVPCKVIGKVNKGDLIVTSAIDGYAIADNDAKVGTIIGKAIGEKTDDAKGVVEVLVGRT